VLPAPTGPRAIRVENLSKKYKPLEYLKYLTQETATESDKVLLTCDGISIARCRELLGEEADGLSDEDIKHIRQHADAMAHVIVEIFLEQRGAQE
jgi:hypothetical protein